MLAAALLLASIRLATPSPFNCPAFEPFRCPTEQRCIAIQVSIRNVISHLSNLPSARKYHQTPHMKLVFRHNQQQPVSHNYRPSPRNIIFIAYPLCYNHIYFIQFYIHVSTYLYLRASICVTVLRTVLTGMTRTRGCARRRGGPRSRRPPASSSRSSRRTAPTTWRSCSGPRLGTDL